MKTLKFSLFWAMALVFVVGVSVPMVHAQGNLHDTWYKAKMKSKFTRGWLTGTDGTLVKVKPSFEYFFKVCNKGGTSDCGAVDYDVVLAIADFDGDGIFEADEVFDVTLATCGPDETSFVAELDITDDLDVDDDPATAEVFNQAANGLVRGENNNKLRSLGCTWTSDSVATDLRPDITGRKCRFIADPVPIDELPFTAEDLVAEGVIGDVSDLDCTSTVFADAGPDLTVKTGERAFPNGSQSIPTGGTYAWVLTSRPPLSDAALTDSDEVEANLLTDLEGTYTVELTYTVGEDSDTDTVVVTAVPEVIADAGFNKSVAQGALVNLNGGASTPEGGTFSWAFLVLPPDSAAVLGASDTVSPFFTADEVGYYIIELTYTVGLFSDTAFIAVLVAR